MYLEAREVYLSRVIDLLVMYNLLNHLNLKQSYQNLLPEGQRFEEASCWTRLIPDIIQGLLLKIQNEDRGQREWLVILDLSG